MFNYRLWTRWSLFKKGGYDYLVQAMGGIMSITGEKNGPPTKIGVGVSDIITGLYSCISILAALRFREKHLKVKVSIFH